jgi:hypothetical protein
MCTFFIVFLRPTEAAIGSIELAVCTNPPRCRLDPSLARCRSASASVSVLLWGIACYEVGIEIEAEPVATTRA